MGVIIMDEKTLKPISEVSYLTTENAWRYRAILRYFYHQHERLRHYLFSEEVYEHLMDSPYFENYTPEQLQQDLNQLVTWKNLIPRQETGRVTTIEEFKRKRFRYQCSPYTVEIERMVLNLEQMGESFGGSLERTIFDRLLEGLNKLETIEKLNPEETYQTWEGIYSNFRKLTENATDYLAHLKSEKVEELMMTEAFLSYKDAITEYLRNFMASLQKTSMKIEAILMETTSKTIHFLAESVAQYQLSIPRLDQVPTLEELERKHLEQWKSLETWFLGQNGRESDLIFLQNETNQTIRKITRFAQRLGERHHNFRSRRKDYLYLAKWFHGTEDLNEAHRLSSCVFGVFKTRHIFTDSRESEDIYAEVWDEHPTQLTLKPRIRQYREKTKTGAVINRKEEKQKMLKQYLLQREAEQRLINQLIKQDKIVLNELETIDPYIRKTILNWIGKCMSNVEHKGKTESGRKFKLQRADDSKVTITSEDGALTMPNYVFTFID